MKKTFFVFTLIVVAVCSLAADAQDSGRVPPPTWQVQKYDIDIVLPHDNARTATVRAVLDLRNVSPRPAGTLTLRISPSAEISAVTLNGTAAEFSRNEEKIDAVNSLQRVSLRTVAIPAGGGLTAAVDYKLTVKDNTALATLSPAGAAFLPLSFWYPTPNSWYYPRGADSAPVRIKVSGPQGTTIIGPGSEAGGAYDLRVKAQPFVLSGSWDRSEHGRVAVFAPRGIADGTRRANELSAVATEAYAFVGTLLGKGPDVPIRIAAARRGAGFSAGGVIVVDEAVFRRSAIDPLTVMHIAEGVARLWIGSGISVNGEGYGVITEGLPRYIATQFIEQRYGKEIADVERSRQRAAYASISGRDAPMATVTPVDDFYYTAVANKGAMMWRILARRVGNNEFWGTLRTSAEDGALDLFEIRNAFSLQKDLLDNLLDSVTTTNLLVGLPQVSGAETKVALRNTGSSDAVVDVTATNASGEKITTTVTLRATSFGEVAFRSAAKIVRVEVDSEKLVPQTDYSDDVAPREAADSDPLATVKRLFDKQEYAGAETASRTHLRDHPSADDMRVLLARSLLGLGKNAEAEREFRNVLSEKLPTARSLAWANVGLAEIASRANQRETALRYAEAAIMADGEYGASLAARNLRATLGAPQPVDPAIKNFFSEFDKAAVANRKADIETMVMPGEIKRFAAGVAGSTEQWQTQVRNVDMLSANTAWVEALMTIKLLNKDVETGLAVFRLVKVGNSWRLAAVDMFEIR